MTRAAEPPAVAAAEARLEASAPAPVRQVIDRLAVEGCAAYVVGGSLRDALLGRTPADWDLATDAQPDRLVRIFPGSVYENRFGTVAVRHGDEVFEITTFRTEHEYADFRRPHRVEFGSDVLADLARRDFTVNAMAWGREPGDGLDDERARLHLVDPHAGLTDLGGRRLRAVGDPAARFREDALRMIRAVRLAATLEFEIEPVTLAAIATHAELARHLSGERVGAELDKLMAAPRPSVGLRMLESTGLLAVVLPELADQRGIPQNKVEGDDLWDHTLRTVDAAPADRPVVRLAALLHDIGKPSTLSGGRFHGHEALGAEMALRLLRRLRHPRAVAERVAHLVRHHMFVIEADASDAAVRRFIVRVGRPALDELFELRAADDAGSSLEGDGGALEALQRRVSEVLEAQVALDRGDLAVDGHDLMRELGLEPGPRLGRMLDELFERVVTDPALNDRPTLLLLAQGMLADMGEQ
jgi:tRNA nucleotidyltransferase (CCA-adding enzyme)